MSILTSIFRSFSIFLLQSFSLSLSLYSHPKISCRGLVPPRCEVIICSICCIFYPTMLSQILNCVSRLWMLLEIGIGITSALKLFRRTCRRKFWWWGRKPCQRVQSLCTNTDSSQCNVKCIEKLLGKLHAAPAVVVPPIIITLQFAVTL